MSINIIQYPRLTKSSSPLEVSRWNGVHQPILFYFQRKDYSVAGITNYSGNILVNLNSDIDPISDIDVGDTVYLNSGPYVGAFEVLTDLGTAFELDTPFISNSSSGYVNTLTQRANYYLECQVLNVDGLNYEIVGTIETRPDATGLALVDISPYLRSLAYLEDDLSYNNGEANEKQPGLGTFYNLRYREKWTGSSQSFTAISPINLSYFVNGAKQIQETYGSNMAEFVLFPPDVASPPAQHSLALFLSAFDRPTYFVGFPFSLSFIYSENISSFGCYREESFLNINGLELSSTSSLLEVNEALNVNALYLSSSGSSLVHSVDVWIETDTDEDNLFDYVDDDFADPDFSESYSSETLPDNYNSPT